VFEELTFVPVDTLDEVLQAALLPHPTATLDNLLAAGESNRTEGVEHIRQ
jgi:ATP-dependent Lon protease